MGGESEVFITPFNAERLNSDLYQMVAASYLRSCNTTIPRKGYRKSMYLSDKGF